MKLKQLGNTNTKVSEIGLGCMGMSEFYGPSDEQENLETLNYALELGINFFDTADIYGMGANEILLSKLLKQHRNKIILATKFGIVRDPSNATTRTISGRPEYVKKACEDSLKRLGIDTIDLYYMHRIDKTVPIEETVGAMASLVAEGKIKYLGLSEVSATTLTRAHKVHPITALQSEYSLWTRDPEAEIIPTCEELDITFVPYSPLGRGFLSNKISSPSDLDSSDFRLANPRFQGDNFAKNQKLVKALSEFASGKNCTPAQLALAWVLAKSSNIVPIPGTRRKKYLEENVKATSLDLSSDEVSALDDIFKFEKIAGDRYTAIGMQTLDE